MSSARETILAAVRAARPAGEFALPVLPQFAVTAHDFAARLEAMGGHALVAPFADPLAPVRERLAGSSAVCSLVEEWAGNVPAGLAPAAYGDLDIALVRACCGVAETGSVLFTNAELGPDSIAYLAQHLIVLLAREAILPDLAAAYRRPEFAQAGYAVLHSGPSATADIEGVLIRGAQGVRSLTVVVIASPLSKPDSDR